MQNDNLTIFSILSKGYIVLCRDEMFPLISGFHLFWVKCLEIKCVCKFPLFSTKYMININKSDTITYYCMVFQTRDEKRQLYHTQIWKCSMIKTVNSQPSTNIISRAKALGLIRKEPYTILYVHNYILYTGIYIYFNYCHLLFYFPSLFLKNKIVFK
jgi:hypothetical protein